MLFIISGILYLLYLLIYIALCCEVRGRLQVIVQLGWLHFHHRVFHFQVPLQTGLRAVLSAA